MTTQAPPRPTQPCRALGCACPDYSRGARVGLYEQCSECHHTVQIHAVPKSKPTSRL